MLEAFEGNLMTYCILNIGSILKATYLQNVRHVIHYDFFFSGIQYYRFQKYSLYVTSLTDLFCITSVFFERLSGKKEIVSLPESGQKANADTTPKTYRLIYRPTYLLCWDQEDSIFYFQKG